MKNDRISYLHLPLQPRLPFNKCHKIYEFTAHVFFQLQVLLIQTVQKGSEYQENSLQLSKITYLKRNLTIRYNILSYCYTFVVFNVHEKKIKSRKLYSSNYTVCFIKFNERAGISLFNLNLYFICLRYCCNNYQK